MSYLKCTCCIQVKVCFPKKEIDYLMLLNKAVVKTLDARGKLSYSKPGFTALIM